MAVMATSVSAYAVRSTVRTSANSSRAALSTSVPERSGMRWSDTTSATGSSRSFSSRSASTACSPPAAAIDAVVTPVAGAEVAADRSQHRWVVVDRHDDRALGSGVAPPSPEDGAVAGERSDTGSLLAPLVGRCAGSLTRNTVEPGFESTVIWPPELRTMLKAMLNPRPVPCPVASS